MIETVTPDCVGQGSASELTSLKSPRDLNGYGYFHARLGWTVFGLRANIVEKYVLFSRVARGCCTGEKSC